MVRRLLRGLAALLLLLLFLVLGLRFWPAAAPVVEGPFELIAHRGVHQTFPLTNLTDETCTASIIHPVTHGYLENTIPSIQAAFDAGATMVEMDIHHTSDGHLVVFHDWTLDCRTDGKGVTQEQPLAYLKGLDIGYGYTADGGKTFPFRGKGVGMMPTLEEVLERFPDKKLILHQKSGSTRTVEVLAGILQKYPAAQRGRLHYWGSRYQELRALVPDIGPRLLDRGGMKACGLAYLRTGGLTSLPEECAGEVMMLPVWAVKYLWGWPNRFMRRVVEGDARFLIAEVDSVEEAERLIELPVHGFMTNHIELVGPWLRSRAR
jgi:glycerophosphoryl diester phosphodiesterase